MPLQIRNSDILRGRDGAGCRDDAARSEGQNDPENDVREKAGASANQEQNPDEADDCWIHVEVVGKAAQTPAIFLSVLERMSFLCAPVAGERPGAPDSGCFAPQL